MDNLTHDRIILTIILMTPMILFVLTSNPLHPPGHVNSLMHVRHEEGGTLRWRHMSVNVTNMWVESIASPVVREDVGMASVVRAVQEDEEDVCLVSNGFYYIF